jgi:hypothetical protein
MFATVADSGTRIGNRIEERRGHGTGIGASDWSNHRDSRDSAPDHRGPRGSLAPLLSRKPGLPFLLAVLASLVFLAGCEPLTANELQHEAGAIHSTAAEGALVADGVARQRTLSSFARAHAKELADAADTSARKLHDATVPDSLRRPTTKAIDLATRTSTVLGDLELSPSNPQLAAGLESRLKRLATAATRLENSL